MYASKIQEHRAITESLAALIARRDELAPLVQEQLDLVALVNDEIISKGFVPMDIALAICPELELLLGASVKKTGTQNKSGKTRKARVLKIYENPHSGEQVQTKGGNHKTLKEWKAKWGGAVVETWVKAG